MTKTRKKKKKANEEVVQKPKEAETDAERTFDFGGIPERDLKKNLGCG